MKRILPLLLTLLCLSFIPADNDGKSDDVVGTWLIGSKRAHVRIYEFGGLYFGRISWLKEPNDKDGNPRTDINNPDESKQKEPLMDLRMLSGFKYKGDHLWSGGTIYDPNNGKTYSCKMWFDDGNTDELKMRGYIGISLIGRTDTWTRVKK